MIAGREIGMDSFQERVDGRVLMIAGDGCVRVEPDAFDPVLGVAVRRQEVQADAGGPGAPPGAHTRRTTPRSPSRISSAKATPASGGTPAPGELPSGPHFHAACTSEEVLE
ncbi:MAG: hypothetical protein AB7N70_26855 [Dehalococcoidia bacterium]